MVYQGRIQNPPVAASARKRDWSPRALVPVLVLDGEPDLRLERIEIRDRRESLAVPLDTEPRAVVLDPRTFVLMDAEVTRAAPPR